MRRQLLAVVLVAVLAATAVGFTLGQASNPPRAEAVTSNAQIVTQLRRLNAKASVTNTNLAAMKARLDSLNTQVGSTQTAAGSVRGLLTIICDYTASISCSP